jgi:hypothetical protein
MSDKQNVTVAANGSGQLGGAADQRSTLEIRELLTASETIRSAGRQNDGKHDRTLIF